jgi:hypothetical protein
MGAPLDARLVIRYEDLRSDTRGHLRRALTFLHQALDDEALSQVVARNSMASMKTKEDEARGGVFRSKDRGTRFVGGSGRHTWQELLSTRAEASIRRYCAQAMEACGYT